MCGRSMSADDKLRTKLFASFRIIMKTCGWLSWCSQSFCDSVRIRLILVNLDTIRHCAIVSLSFVADAIPRACRSLFLMGPEHRDELRKILADCELANIRTSAFNLTKIFLL